jgi:hypothetical protein
VGWTLEFDAENGGVTIKGVDTRRAWNPSPADDANCVNPNVVLSWSPGCFADSHDVYLGTSFDEVYNGTRSSPAHMSSQDPNRYPVAGTLNLDLCKTYHWRIDEVNDPNIWKGEVWSFTTICPSCCVPPPADMVAWWPLDENSGTIANDRAGDINDQGTLINGASFTLSAVVDGGLHLDGDNDYVNVPNSPELNFGEGDLSIDAWINTNSNQDIVPIVDKRSFSNVGYTLFLYNSGRLSLLLADSDEWWYWNDPSSSDLRDGQWHHVAATVDRDDPNGGRLYVGGHLIHTFDPTRIEGDITNTPNLWIGRRCPVGGAQTDKWFGGEIDEVELFDRALDANEVRAIFDANWVGKCKCEPGLSYKDDVKWSQPPVKDDWGCIEGWDEVSDYNRAPIPIVADDWLCKDDRPIKGIHWWGSFIGWTEPNQAPPDEMPDAFHIGIWTDVPDPDPNEPNTFSHPGELIWDKICDSYVWSFAGCDVDPRKITGIDACFRFDQLLSQDEWFYQDPNNDDGTVYWLSIAAIYEEGLEPNFPWGWKTRPDCCIDDAVRIQGLDGGQWPPEIGSIWENGEPIEYPEGASWDMAFVLTANREYSLRRWSWPDEEAAIADVHTDGIIDFRDYAILANHWLEEAYALCP